MLLTIDLCNVVGGLAWGVVLSFEIFFERLLAQAFAAGRIDKRLSSASWDEEWSAPRLISLIV